MITLHHYSHVSVFHLVAKNVIKCAIKATSRLEITAVPVWYLPSFWLDLFLIFSRKRNCERNVLLDMYVYNIKPTSKHAQRIYLELLLFQRWPHAKIMLVLVQSLPLFGMRILCVNIWNDTFKKIELLRKKLKQEHERNMPLEVTQ